MCSWGLNHLSDRCGVVANSRRTEKDAAVLPPINNYSGDSKLGGWRSIECGIGTEAEVPCVQEGGATDLGAEDAVCRVLAIGHLRLLKGVAGIAVDVLRTLMVRCERKQLLCVS